MLLQNKKSSLIYPAWIFLLRQDVKFTGINLKRLARRNKRSKASIIAQQGPIVSLTTYGKRIRTVYLAIESIADGSVLPSRIILWLDDRDLFRNLPVSLRRLEERGLEVRLCPNYGPHTKYYPYLQLTDVFTLPLVTADDDVLYPRNWLSDLVTNYNQDSTVVNCHRASVMKVVDGNLAPYLSWGPCRSTEAKSIHFAIGSNGCIFPPQLLKEILAAGNKFEQLCPKADDLWLHVNTVRAGFKVKQIGPRPTDFPLLPDTQDIALFHSNTGLFQNDVQIKNTYSQKDISMLL